MVSLLGTLGIFLKSMQIAERSNWYQHKALEDIVNAVDSSGVTQLLLGGLVRMQTYCARLTDFGTASAVQRTVEAYSVDTGTFLYFCRLFDVGSYSSRV